jgi:hypothetical protein
VTEAEWLACGDPGPMLESLQGKVGDRKLWLYAAACCRRIQQGKYNHVFHTTTAQDELGRAIEATERCAEGEAGARERSAPWLEWMAAEEAASGADLMWYSYLRAVVGGSAWHSARIIAADARALGDAGAAPLVRDIFGNPSRPVAFDPAWRSPTAVSLARGLYESRDFSALPVLADALQDAGCEHPDILGHCRGGGEHVRGCWVVDLVLGKG